ncbi:hypothetical protein GW796_06785 [archaeon]|nr:hypothetical protein [archaeon]
MLKIKINEFSIIYEKMLSYRKKLILFGIFIAIIIGLAEILMFKSMDSYSKVSKEQILVIEQKTSLIKEDSEIQLKNSLKSKNALLKKKDELLKEIDDLLNTDKNKKYIPSESVPKLIETIVNSTSELTMESFQNLPKVSQQESQSVLVKHFFKLTVKGEFQSIYNLLVKLEGISGLHIYIVDISKQENKGIVGNFEFYVINTNASILSF